jgi:outer membrane protein assembly factor BamB
MRAQLFTVALSAVGVASMAWVAEATDPTPRTLLNRSGIQGGLVVHVGCGDGSATAQLHAGDGFLVHGLDCDSDQVAAARNHIDQAGLAGPVSVARWTNIGQLPYADNLVNLLVVEDAGRLEDAELQRVLVPRGIAYVKEPEGGWRKIEKPWPAGMDGWSHWQHGADGNPVSRDTLVGPPRRMQWVDGPSWSKKHWGPRLSALVSAGGRLFYVQDETPTSLFNIDAHWVLSARDAFNGVILWRRELPDWTDKGWGRVVRRGGEAADTGLLLGVWGELSGGSGVRDAMDVMVAGEDRLYVPLSHDGPVSALDAATGQVLQTYAQIAPVQKVVLTDGILLISGRGKVCALRADSGQLLWETSGSDPCATGDRVFLADRKGTCLAAVQLESGSRLWETEFSAAVQATGGKSSDRDGAFTGPLQVGAGVVLMGSGDRGNVQTFALAASDGRPLWRQDIGDRPFGRGGGPFIIDNCVWSLDAGKGVLSGFDPLTGDVREQVDAPAIRYVGHHARCYLARATCQYIIGKERGADFIDLDSGRVTWNNWLRGPCHRGVLPANGLLYAGQHSCRCYTESALHGFHALAPDQSLDVAAGVPEKITTAARAEGQHETGDTRLEQGPAYADVAAINAHARDVVEPSSIENSADWPTFRHDPARSGATPAEFPNPATVRWTADIGSPLSAPVIAAGRVCVAAVDRHTLYSLDASTGRVVWQYVAGGRIDSPPTIHRGLALFGCRDGWVVCLRASDGSLVWRRRAAPEERLVGAYGQLESAWPVAGSVLVKDDVAYCVAGRSSYLDGGLFVLAIDPSTGNLLHTRQLNGPWPDAATGSSPQTPNRGFTSQGALPDVLVADAEHIYLRHLRFDATLQEMLDMQPNVYVPEELAGENRGGDHKYWDNLLEAPRHANFTDPAWFHRSFFQNFPGRRLYATTGLIDQDGWHRRMYWSYGQVVGQYLVFRGEMGYAVQVFATSPREGGFNAGDGYVVYAGRTAEREQHEKLFALRPDQSTWRIRVPFRPLAMVLAGRQLILAGPSDSADPTEALAALEGQGGAILWAIDTADGTVLAEQRLEHAPRYDGLAIAGGRCYLTTLDGRVVCLDQ